MKLFQKIIPTILILCLVFLSQSVFAQRHHNPERMLEKMKTELDLTDQQVEQIEAIFETGKSKMEALRDAEYEDRDAKRTAMRAFKQEQKAAIEKVLNPDQLEKFQAMKKHKRKRHKGPKLSKEQHQSLRAEMERYKKENIHPVLIKQRAKLDASISPEDQRLIQALRPKLKAEKELHEAERQKRMDAFMKGEKTSKEERKKKKGKHKKKMKSENFKAAQKLAEKYEENINALLAEVEVQQKKWDEDIRQIRDKYKKQMRQERHQETRSSDDPDQTKKRKKRKGKKHAKKKEMRKVHFLMLDPNAETIDTEWNNITEGSIQRVEVYPNPSITENTIQFEVLDAGKVSIELRDKSGNLVRSIEESYKEAGNYNINVNLDALKNGVYYYTIKDSNGRVITKKFVLMQ